MVTVTCTDLDNVEWKEHSPIPPTGRTNAVWRASLLHPAPYFNELFSLLQAEEKQRASRFYRTEDQCRFVLARGMLRRIIGFYLSVPAADVKFALAENGKPYLQNAGTVPLHFNLSHSGNRVLISIGHSATGVDVEKINATVALTEMAELCFSTEEQQVLQTAPDPLLQFYRFWTRKESLLKATGAGLINELTTITCRDGTNKLSGSIIRSLSDWQIHSFHVDADHIGSVAAVPGTQFQFLDFDACSAFLP